MPGRPNLIAAGTGTCAIDRIGSSRIVQQAQVLRVALVASSGGENACTPGGA